MGFGKGKTGAIVREIPKITLGALAANTVVFAASGQIGTGLSEDFRMLKTEILANIQPASINDSIVVGICSGDLTITEVAECLGVVGPPGRGDVVETEQAMRPVWPLFMRCGDVSRHDVNDSMVYAHKGKPWTFQNGKGWFWFAYNPSTTTAFTTGGVVELLTTSYGVWLD